MSVTWANWQIRGVVTLQLQHNTTQYFYGRGGPAAYWVTVFQQCFQSLLRAATCFSFYYPALKAALCLVPGWRFMFCCIFWKTQGTAVGILPLHHRRHHQHSPTESLLWRSTSIKSFDLWCLAVDALFIHTFKKKCLFVLYWKWLPRFFFFFLHI